LTSIAYVLCSSCAFTACFDDTTAYFGVVLEAVGMKVALPNEISGCTDCCLNEIVAKSGSRNYFRHY